MKWTRKDLILQAKNSCTYQEDLSINSIKRYVRVCDYISQRKNITELSLFDVEIMGRMISRKNGPYGFRNTPAIFRNGESAVHHSQIHRMIRDLLFHGNLLNADEFFIHLEKIHPFNDGNGRVGEIIYWWMTGSFNCPHNHFSNHD